MNRHPFRGTSTIKTGFLCTVVMGWFLGMLPLVGRNPVQASEKIKNAPLAEPSEDQALVYFVREKAFKGGGRTMFLFLDADFVGTVDNGTHTYAYVAPGERLFWSQFFQRSMRLDLDAGEIYFLSVGPFDVKFISAEEGLSFIDEVGLLSQATPKEEQTARKYLQKHYDRITEAPPGVKVDPQSYCGVEVRDEVAMKSIGAVLVEPFSSGTDSPYSGEVIAEWSAEMPRLLVKELQRRGTSDARVSEEASTESQPGDFFVQGEILDLDKGSAWRRVMFGGKKSQVVMRIKVSLLKHGENVPVADFDCTRGSVGGLARVGGVFAAGTKNKMHEHMERFAEEIAELITGVDKKQLKKKSKR